MGFNLAAVIKMSAKKRKYNEEYLQYGFTDAAVNGQVVPQCVIQGGPKVGIQLLNYFLCALKLPAAET